jgi:hypothetical protein
MKKILQILALIIALGGVATWVVTGANRGWTKTSVAVKTLDEVTGIEGITYQKKFLPGVDFLGAAFGGAALLFGTSLFFRRPTSKQTNNQP